LTGIGALEIPDVGRQVYNDMFPERWDEKRFDNKLRSYLGEI
jgi:hypothetical protein